MTRRDVLAAAMRLITLIFLPVPALSRLLKEDGGLILQQDGSAILLLGESVYLPLVFTGERLES